MYLHPLSPSFSRVWRPRTRALFWGGRGYTARCGCSNNVCCLKGYNMFPVCYKTPGSSSCCDSQLLLQKHITVEDHVRLWRSHCLQSSACGVHSDADVQVLVTGDWPSWFWRAAVFFLFLFFMLCVLLLMLFWKWFSRVAKRSQLVFFAYAAREIQWLLWTGCLNYMVSFF